MNIIPRRRRINLAACPVGLFLSGDTLCLKTDYRDNSGRIDAYIVATGKFFWGGPRDAASQRKVMVTPCVIMEAP